MKILCPTCNASHDLPNSKISQGARGEVTCKNCGAQILIVPPSDQPETGEFEFITEPTEFKGYAGFWKRFGAGIVDGFILMVAGVMIGGLIGLTNGLLPGASEGTRGWGNIVGIIMGWLYFAVMESSYKQGTLGKMALGIKVTDLSGNAISFGRATIRHFGKVISTLLLLLGYVMVGFTARKQGLHDMIAGCLVVNSK
jgi:uncharacterized RDD family membrane protein YckC